MSIKLKLDKTKRIFNIQYMIRSKRSLDTGFITAPKINDPVQNHSIVGNALPTATHPTIAYSAAVCRIWELCETEKGHENVLCYHVARLFQWKSNGSYTTNALKNCLLLK